MDGFVTGPVTVTVPATSANLGPGFDSLGLALDLRDTLTAEVYDGPLTIVVTGEGAGDVPSDGRHLVHRAMAATFDALGVTTPRSPARPATTGSRTRAGSARRRPRSSAGSCSPGPWSTGESTGSTTPPRSTSRTGSRATPTTSRRPCSAASRSPSGTTARVTVARLRRRPRHRRGGVRAARPGADGRGQRAAARRRTARGRGGQRRTRGPAGRCADRTARPAAGGHRRPAAPGLPPPGDAALAGPGRRAACGTASRPWSPAPDPRCWRSCPSPRSLTSYGAPHPAGWGSPPGSAPPARRNCGVEASSSTPGATVRKRHAGRPYGQPRHPSGASLLKLLTPAPAVQLRPVAGRSRSGTHCHKPQVAQGPRPLRGKEPQ